MIYVAAILYVAISIALNAWVTRHHENAWWSMIVYVGTAPALIALFPAIAVYAMIYFTAYPDRHAHEVDICGTEDARRRLNDYRDACNDRSFLRRFLEGMRIWRYTGPELPDFSDDDVNRPDGRQYEPAREHRG